MNVTKVKTAIVALQEANGTLEISADVIKTTEAPMFSPSENGSISNGEVRKDGNRVGTFSSSNAVSLTTNYSIEDADVRLEIHQAVQQFVQNAREFIKSSTIKVENNENQTI